MVQIDRNPLVSVVVTTNNRKELLAKTIRSILNQTFNDFEIILVDNFSNYDIESLVETFNDPRVKLVQNRNNGIIAVNRNVGISYSQGTYLAFCDDDDCWFPDKLNLQLVEALKNPDEKVLIYTDAEYEKTNGEKYIDKKRQIISDKDVLTGSNIYFSSIFVKKTPLVKFDESVELVASEDFKLICDLYYNDYKFIHIAKTLLDYRVALTSASRENSISNYGRKNYIIMYCLLKYRDKINNKATIYWHMLINELKAFIKVLM